MAWTLNSNPQIGGAGSSVADLSIVQAWVDYANQQYPQLTHLAIACEPEHIEESATIGPSGLRKESYFA